MKLMDIVRRFEKKWLVVGVSQETQSMPQFVELLLYGTSIRNARPEERIRVFVYELNEQPVEASPVIRDCLGVPIAPYLAVDNQGAA